MNGYFVADDAVCDVWIWREQGDTPIPVLSKHMLRDDPALWNAVVALVEGAS